ncbi:MAG: YraN family protein [Clostridia bacterium]|nr:YraN family protein [Clostridia bacterium]
MKRTAKGIGNIGEHIAEQYLRKKGWRIIARNYAANGGEIDVVGYRFGTLVYFEVKARTGEQFGKPADAVDTAKLSRIKNASLALKAAHSKNGKIPVFYPFGIKLMRTFRRERIDVIEIYLTRDMKVRGMNHIKDMENQL